MKTLHLTLTTFATLMLITACGGGGDEAVLTTETPSTTTTTNNPTPTGCTAAPISTTGYSLVFKRCSVTGVAEYYDKTECVRDNASGLIWEGKPATGTRANTNVYTNYDSTFDFQKPHNGSFEKPTQAHIDAPSNSIGFKNAVNNSNLCGLNNWRIPLRIELQSIQTSSGIVDANWFPNTALSFYWSSSLTPSLPNNLAIVVNFTNGGYGDFGRNTSQSVRLVSH